MSSNRKIKKQINTLTQEFISDAFAVIGKHLEKREEVIEQISDIVELRNTTIKNVNRPEIPEGSTVKQWLHDVRKTFLHELDNRYKNLSKLTSGARKKSGTAKKKTVKKPGGDKEEQQDT